MSYTGSTSQVVDDDDDYYNIKFTPINKGTPRRNASIPTAVDSQPTASAQPNTQQETAKDPQPSGATASRSPLPAAKKKNKAAPPDGPAASAVKQQTPPDAVDSTPAKSKSAGKSRGEAIMAEGHPATNPCDRCRSRGVECLVPRDPQRAATFKCGPCIRAQQGCSLSAESPGRDDYDETYRSKCAKREMRLGQKKGKRTRRKRVTQAAESNSVRQNARGKASREMMDLTKESEEEDSGTD